MYYVLLPVLEILRDTSVSLLDQELDAINFLHCVD